MEPITFDSTSYWIGDRPVYLNAGEFHYFRVPKNHWRPRMEHFKAAGGTCLSTYIPWLIHEPTERYPDVRARTIEGTPFGHPSVSYVHPVYLEKAKRWLAAVAERLSPYTVSRGGPIAFTQIDNELTGIHIWFGGLDYHPESMGFGRPDGRYPRYLARRYGDISRLNTAYQTQYSDFATVRPLKPLEARPGHIPHIRRLRDYFEYYLSTVTEYMEIIAQTLREHGVDTPFIHNAANPDMNAYFYDMQESLGPDFLIRLGPLLQPRSGLAPESPHPPVRQKCPHIPGDVAPDGVSAHSARATQRERIRLAPIHLWGCRSVLYDQSGLWHEGT